MDDWICALAQLAAWGISIDTFVAAGMAGVEYTYPSLDSSSTSVIFFRVSTKSYDQLFFQCLTAVSDVVDRGLPTRHQSESCENCYYSLLRTNLHDPQIQAGRTHLLRHLDCMVYFYGHSRCRCPPSTAIEILTMSSITDYFLSASSWQATLFRMLGFLQDHYAMIIMPFPWPLPV